MQAVKQKTSGYLFLVGTIMAALLTAYGLAEAFQVPYLTGVPDLNSANVLAPLISIGLLTVDVLLPVPSSIIMATNGALFGFWVGGLVSLIGNILGFLLAYWLGRQTSPLVRNVLSPQEMDRGSRVLQKWGTLALIITRPLPILGETTSIMTGVAGLPFVKSLVAVIIGSLPAVMLYAWAGSHVSGFNVTALIFLALICLSAVAWVVDKRMQKGRKLREKIGRAVV